MANNTCASTLKACMTRVLRLTSTGILFVGTSSKYTTDQQILVGHTPIIPDRERIEQLNGCGDQCLLFIGAAKAVESDELTLNLCSIDAELTEILAGGSVIVSTYNTIGYLAPTDATVDTEGVAFEVWTYAWKGRARHLSGASPGYWHWFWPKTTWAVGATTLENGVGILPLSGVATPNSSFGTGLAADPIPVTVGDATYGYFLTATIPTAACGYAAIP